MDFSNDFIKEHEKKIAASIAEKYEFEPDAFFRFWNKDTIQIDGDLTLAELKVLVEIMEAIKG